MKNFKLVILHHGSLRPSPQAAVQDSYADVPTVFCWSWNHRLSALPGKRLNGAAVNNHLRSPSPPLLSCLSCPNAPCKMRRSPKGPDRHPASKAFWDSISVNIPPLARQRPGRRASCRPERNKADGRACDWWEAEIIESTQHGDLCSLHRRLRPFGPLSCVLSPTNPELSTAGRVYSDYCIMKAGFRRGSASNLKFLQMCEGARLTRPTLTLWDGGPAR